MQINGLEFKIGADPEFFVKRHGNIVSAHGLVPGTKDHPMKVKKGAVQVDGMALEFNIDPAKDYAAFEANMSTVLNEIISMVPGYEPYIEPVAEFGAAYIAMQPKVARELGCSPDFNAYTRKANPRPSADVPFRTASGHVHIGWHDTPVDINDPGHLEACYALTKSLDVWLGIPSLAWDEDTKRRSLYGAAGAFRPKPYGMEYRVLSNKWINSALLRKTVYNNTIKAIEATFNNPEFGDNKYMGLTAQQILDQKNEKWMDAAYYAMQYGGISSPKVYR